MICPCHRGVNLVHKYEIFTQRANASIGTTRWTDGCRMRCAGKVNFSPNAKTRAAYI